MTRVVHLAMLASVAGLLTVSTVQAQTVTSNAGQMHAEVVGGPVFGSQTSASFGGEFDYGLTDTYEVFAEGGRMFDVASSEAEARAQRVADFIHGTGTIKQAANYFAAGIKYRFPPQGSGFIANWTPYVGIGAGIARVTNKPTFIVDGTDVTDQLLDRYGIELGNDLADATSKPLMVIIAGGQRPIMSRFVLDVTYRYGRILARTSAILDDISINTNRLQVGFGIGF